METKKETIAIANLTCGSCERVIRKALSTEQGVSSLEFDFQNKTVTVEHDQDMISGSRVAELIKSKGYDVQMLSAQTRQTHAAANAKPSAQKKKTNNTVSYHIEKRMIKTALLTLLVLVVLHGILYFGFFQDGATLRQQGIFIFYLMLGVVANAIAIKHIRCYQETADCMSGMMIGMTLGMISGFMGGAVVGATNGMFIGSVYGMIIGMTVGAWCGKCCGIMGIMEGLMAGLMGGTMGAMLSIMMVFDHLRLFLTLLFAACLAILGGLAYMVHLRNRENGPVKLTQTFYDTSLFILICYLITFITSLIIIYGPKTGVTGA